jgi:hypothetical protein
MTDIFQWSVDRIWISFQESLLLNLSYLDESSLHHISALYLESDSLLNSSPIHATGCVMQTLRLKRSRVIGFDGSDEFTASGYLAHAGEGDGLQKGSAAEISLMSSSSSVGAVLFAVGVTLFLMKCLVRNQAIDHAESETESDSESEMSDVDQDGFEERWIAPGLDSALDEPSGENDLTSSLDDLPFASDEDESF